MTVVCICLYLSLYLSVCLCLAEPIVEAVPVPVAPAGDDEPPADETVDVEESEIDHLSDVVC